MSALWAILLVAPVYAQQPTPATDPHHPATPATGPRRAGDSHA